ncbi:unnamed protein product [Didymodactylos carnosus]|uniref:Retrotransposon gag domain-containing protein n=1 Tax=Didymodactylos carnosus TaxID=1234261 RepID=A0A815NA45_9BILA|nr:unnamed protein product [Didymodactylos carnosus]CAF4309808.1 unnamed protein product [Didymodactylos carnosus]
MGAGRCEGDSALSDEIETILTQSMSPAHTERIRVKPLPVSDSKSINSIHLSQHSSHHYSQQSLRSGYRPQSTVPVDVLTAVIADNQANQREMLQAVMTLAKQVASTPPPASSQPVLTPLVSSPPSTPPILSASAVVPLVDSENEEVRLLKSQSEQQKQRLHEQELVNKITKEMYERQLQGARSMIDSRLSVDIADKPSRDCTTQTPPLAEFSNIPPATDMIVKPEPIRVQSVVLSPKISPPKGERVSFQAATVSSPNTLISAAASLVITAPDSTNKFSGKTNEAPVRFLHDYRQQALSMFKWTESQMLDSVGQWLSGGAAEWFSLLKQSNDFPQTWDEFKKIFLSRFRSPERVETLKLERKNCMQREGESVVDFYQRYRSLNIEIDPLTSSEKMTKGFLRKINADIEIRMASNVEGTLEDVVRRAEAAELAILHRKQQERRANRGKSPAPAVVAPLTTSAENASSSVPMLAKHFEYMASTTVEHKNASFPPSADPLAKQNLSDKANKNSNSYSRRSSRLYSNRPCQWCGQTGHQPNLNDSPATNKLSPSSEFVLPFSSSISDKDSGQISSSSDSRTSLSSCQDEVRVESCVTDSEKLCEEGQKYLQQKCFGRNKRHAKRRKSGSFVVNINQVGIDQPSSPSCKEQQTYQLARGSVVAKGKLNQVEGMFTIDTGAGMTLVSHHYWKLIGRSEQIRPYSGPAIVGAEGSSVEPLGIIDAVITLADHAISFPVVLARKFNQPLLISNDFMNSAGIVLDIKGSSLWRRDCPTRKFRLSTDLLQAGKLSIPVYAARRLKLSPYSKAYIPVSLSQDYASSEWEASSSGLLGHLGLVTANSLVTVNNLSTSVLLLI